MAGEVMRKCSGRDLGRKFPDAMAALWQSSPCDQRCCSEMLRKNMAPGKTHVNSKLKNKFQAKNKSSSGVKKAKKNSLPKKQLKEKTFQQIEEVNKSFTAVHDILSVKTKSQGVPDSKSMSTKMQARVKISGEKLIPSNTDVTQEELSKTVEDIANL